MAGCLTLTAQPLSVRRARRFVSDEMVAAGLGGLRASAELLTSEIVTNAVVHAGTEITVTVHLAADSVRIEVSDGAPADAIPPPADLERGQDAIVDLGGGRGLLLVQMMAVRWGVEPVDAGKIVWFELSAGAAEALS